MSSQYTERLHKINFIIDNTSLVLGGYVFGSCTWVSMIKWHPRGKQFELWLELRTSG